MCAVRPRSTVNLFRFGSRLNSSSETAVCRPAQSAGENFENPSQSLWLILSHRSEEHTSELQSQSNLVCRLLLEKKKKKKQQMTSASASKACKSIAAYAIQQ